MYLNYSIFRSLSNNRIQKLEANSLQKTQYLQTLDFRGNPIREIHEKAFQNLSKLRKL